MDLAWGRASRGMAVARFDEVTYTHGPQPSRVGDFTLVDDYLHHAAAAVDLLHQLPNVNPQRVFVLGHSLGGTVAPRVAAADQAVAGLVVLAGGAQPLHWATVRRFRFLASLDPANAAAAQPAIDAITRQAQTVDASTGRRTPRPPA
jgi:dienelactone hydrolase